MQKKRTDNFSKFANKKKGSAIKESIRQEKKKIKAEARVAGEEFRKKKLDKMRGVSEEKGIKSQKSAIKSQKKEPKSTASRQHADNQQSAISNQKLPSQSSDIMPLNKFIAHAGVCGRREAAELVKEGKVVVNGDKIFEPGYKVSAKDKVVVKGKQVFLQKNAVYVLLNKPKDYITTSNDPQGRKTVLELVKSATTERIYPVGRLDRNTTGVLLLTNDGELAQKLTHPSFEVKKIYEVTLDKPVTKKDLDTILSGVTLEDGFVSADAVGYADTKSKNIVGIEIHSGRNRIVRRIFEHLGYDVKGLDRVMFANLTKKNVDRGKWRYLNEKEVRLLKFLNNSFIKKTV
ncbi:pseudouridine synthase [Asinibacterium sp. OR53]|jgi:23S rRNA pseudouridine2605 synthase|uniref:pseudouridine synthase n=1 Tax=Asinibacterium sp. OR53 TaxID=925409 RepID=UPI00040814B9|nr:pseudouridine synthase [Asinibacterium sp. OR53]